MSSRPRSATILPTMAAVAAASVVSTATPASLVYPARAAAGQQIELLAPAVGGHHVSPRACQRKGDGAAQGAGAARHQGHAVLELVFATHVVSPFPEGRRDRLSRRSAGSISPPAPSIPFDGWRPGRRHFLRENIHKKGRDHASAGRIEIARHRRRRAGVSLASRRKMLDNLRDRWVATCHNVFCFPEPTGNSTRNSSPK